MTKRVRTAGPPCNECRSSLVYEYPLDPRNLCLGCLDIADPMWREKKLGIKVIVCEKEAE